MSTPPLSALVAFRQDLAADPDQATASDARWLQVVTLLQTAADVSASARMGIVAVAADLVAPEGIAPDGSLRPLPVTVAPPLPSALAALVRAATNMEDAARFYLADAAYDALLRLLPSMLPEEAPQVTAQGLLLALQARVARQLGQVDVARDRYAAAEALGRRHRDGNVLGRAWIGYGLLAQLRGNLPEARKWYVQVLSQPEVARESLQVAHQSLMVIASMSAHFDVAAEHGWASYELAITEDEAAAALADLSELVRASGRPRLALRGFSAALTRTGAAPRHRLPALGGAAMAAAEALAPTEALPLIRAYHGEVEAFASTRHLPYPVANALADLADAYAMAGDAGEATRLRLQVSEIAEDFGYFELLHRVTDGAAPPRAADRGADEIAPVAAAPMEHAQPVLAALSTFEVEPQVARALAVAR